MRGIILAAGFGTRLRPLTDTIPKPLVPVLGVPNILRIIRHLADARVTDLVINLHHLPGPIEALLGNGETHDVSIIYSREPHILGTGGGIKQALGLLGKGDDPIIVVNGDVLFAPDILGLLKAHTEKDALATMVVRADPEAQKRGVVGLDLENRVGRLVWAGDESSGPRAHMFTGVHALSPRIRNLLPDDGCIVRNTYIPLVNESGPLFGFVDDGYFCDLGTPRHYLDANDALVTGRVRVPWFSPPADAVLVSPQASVDPSAVLHPGTIIGPHAKVGPNLSLSNTVVLEGATVRTSHRGAIIWGDESVIHP